MAIGWTDSTSKHGVDRADAANAVAYYLTHIQDYDTPLEGRPGRVDLWLGPQRNAAAPLLEVMAEVTDSDIWFFHVMAMRHHKFGHLLPPTT